MRSLFYKRLFQMRSRLVWPGIGLMMLLQRTPIQWVMAELQFAGGPRIMHIAKWIAGIGLTSAFYNTVTGATGDLSLSGKTTAVVGTSMQVAISADKAVPVTVELEGAIPPGLNSNIGPGGTVANGVIAFSGVPGEPGPYPVTVTILTWEGKNGTYEGSPVFITFAFEITLEGPKITHHPVSMVVPWGGTAQFSVEVANEEGVSYQWQRITEANPNNYADIEGATAPILSMPNATKVLEGIYRVTVTRNELTQTSNIAFLTVNESDYDSWRLRKFDNPGAGEAGELGNPDHDAFTNAFEFYFDLDPEHPDSIQSPKTSHEKILGVDYIVFAFPPVVGGPSLDFSFESTTDLSNNSSWSPLVHGVGGVVIALSSEAAKLKIPYTAEVYCRMKVNTQN